MSNAKGYQIPTGPGAHNLSLSESLFVVVVVVFLQSCNAYKHGLAIKTINRTPGHTK
jgi:hypothetical protein